jgi:hypothetical protein
MHLAVSSSSFLLIMDWLFASGCPPPRLSTTQLPSASDSQCFCPTRTFTPLLVRTFRRTEGRPPCRPTNQIIKCPLTNTGKKWDGTEAVPPIDERTLHGSYIMRTGWPVHSSTACHRSPSGSTRRRPCVTRSKGMWTNVLCHRPISVFVLPAIAA